MKTHAKIVRYSRFAQYLSLFFLIVTPLLYVLLISIGELSLLLKLPKHITFNEAALSTAQRAVLALIPMISIGVYILLFQRLFRLFDHFRKGEFFSSKSPEAIVFIGYVLVAVDFAKTLESFLGSLALNAMGITQSGLYANVGFSMLIVGIFVIIVGNVWKIALQMHENERLTV